MTAVNVRREFRLFHAILGIGLLFLSLQSLQHALGEHEGAGQLHLAAVSALEAIGAALFLIPRTVRWGGGILLLILLVGFTQALTRGGVELQRLIYAAGVWFVMRTYPRHIEAPELPPGD